MHPVASILSLIDGADTSPASAYARVMVERTLTAAAVSSPHLEVLVHQARSACRTASMLDKDRSFCLADRDLKRWSHGRRRRFGGAVARCLTRIRSWSPLPFFKIPGMPTKSPPQEMMVCSFS